MRQYQSEGKNATPALEHASDSSLFHRIEMDP